MRGPEPQALRRAAFLRRLKQKYPALDIYLSSVIMRTTVSTLKQEDQVWWEKGSAVFPACRTAGLRGARRPRAAGGADSASVLRTFLAARGRNHQVNREAVLLPKALSKLVSFLQEDSAPQGMHCAEQKQLQALAANRRVGNRSASTVEQMNAPARLWCLAAKRQAGARPAPVCGVAGRGYAVHCTL